VRVNLFRICAMEFVEVHKEFFDLSNKLFPEIIHRLDVSATVVFLFDGNDAIVTLPVLFLLGLGALDTADDSALQQTSREGWLVHEYNHVNRIAVFRLGGRDETKVIREGHPGRQHFRQVKYPLLGIKRVRIAATLRSLDDNIYRVLRVLINRRRRGWIG
jgi:hypothetical protein